MQDYEKRKAALIDEIERVFDGVERGDGTTFYEGTVLDDGGSEEEMAAARARDTESRWQDVPNETFRKNYSALSFLDLEGLRYYLPALMTWYLRYVDTDGPDSNSTLFGDMIIYLSLSGDEPLDDYRLNRFQAFSQGESELIARFLQFDAEREEWRSAQWCAARVQEMVNEGKNQTEIDAYIERFSKPLPNTIAAQIALDTYWGRFLPAA